MSWWRMETFTTSQGVRVVNDAYNANPESMAAALKARAGDGAGVRLIAVLGHMAELGPDRRRGAREDRGARRPGPRRSPVTVGAQARVIAIAGVREGVEPENVAAYDDADDALADVRGHVREGDVVLVKGSRVAGLEALAETLR